MGEKEPFIKSSEEPMEERPFAWERGYRAWKLRFVPRRERIGKLDVEFKEPRLGSVFGPKSDIWKPGEEGEVVSNWKEGKDKPFEETAKGFYSLREYGEVLERFPEEDIHGAIIPYGKVFYGEKGFRSEKAKVDALFRRFPKCYVCMGTAKYWLHNDESWPLCERCLKKVEKLASKRGYLEGEMEQILQRLAEIYEAEIVEPPEV